MLSKQLKPLFSFGTLITLYLGSIASSAAISVLSDPVGIQRISIPNNSDTHIAVGFHQFIAYEVNVVSVAGSVVTISDGTGWTDNEFVFQENTQENTYYALIAEGPLAGRTYKITANTENTLTLEISDNAELNDLATDNKLKVIPFWTIETLLSGLELDGINALIFDDSTAGINHQPTNEIQYDTANNGWFSGSDDVGATIIYPGESLIIRNNDAGDQVLAAIGSVPMTQFSTLVFTVEENAPQDIHIGLRSPLKMAIGQSGLGSEGDELLVFDSAVTQLTKSATKILEYTSNGGTEGWYDGATLVNTTFFLEPGKGYVLRKAGVTLPARSYWTATPPYLSN